MPRRRRVAKALKSPPRVELTEAAKSILLELPLPTDAPSSLRWARWAQSCCPEAIAPHCLRVAHPLRDIWSAHYEVLLRAWIAARPGTRPAAWWRWSSGTEQPSCFEEELAPLLLLGELSAAEIAAARRNPPRTPPEPAYPWMKSAT